MYRAAKRRLTRRKTTKRDVFTLSILGLVGGIALATAVAPKAAGKVKEQFAAMAGNPDSATSGEAWKNAFKNAWAALMGDVNDYVQKPVDSGIRVGVVALGLAALTKLARKAHLPTVRAGFLRVKAA